MAAKQAGRDPDSIDVSFPPSDIVGASGGLVYALAVADALDERDLARGRTIAATGSLGPDGRIGGVYFVDVKREVARHASADLFLVPPATIDAGDHVVVVRTLDEAIATLLRHA
jgi:PDZ domain-containing protein